MAKKIVKISELRSNITFETQARVSDGMGGFTTTWSALSDSSWAKITPLSGYERLKAEQQQSNITHKIIIRYRSDLAAEQRIKYGTREFAIKYFLNFDEGKNKFLEISAVEGDPS